MLFKPKKAGFEPKADGDASAKPAAKSDGSEGKQSAAVLAQDQAGAEPEIKFEITTSRQFVSWLAKHKIDQRCGLYVIDLETGDVVHWARIEGVVSELYDVAVLPDRKNTAAIGFRTDEIRRVYSLEA